MAAPRIRHHKYVTALPAVLEANAVYYVRSSSGVDVFVTNGSGIIAAYPINMARLFTPAGLAANARFYATTVTTAANGSWAVDLAPAGFTTILNVQPQAIASSGLLTGAAIANCAVRTPKAASGMVLVPLLGGILGLAGAGITVDVLAVGT